VRAATYHRIPAPKTLYRLRGSMWAADLICREKHRSGVPDCTNAKPDLLVRAPPPYSHDFAPEPIQAGQGKCGTILSLVACITIFLQRIL